MGAKVRAYKAAIARSGRATELVTKGYNPEQERDERGRWTAGGYAASAARGMTPGMVGFFKDPPRGGWSPASRGIEMGQAHPSVLAASGLVDTSARQSTQVNPVRSDYVMPSIHITQGTEEAHWEKGQDDKWRMTGRSSYGRSYGTADWGPGRTLQYPTASGEAAQHLNAMHDAAVYQFEMNGLSTDKRTPK